LAVAERWVDVEFVFDRTGDTALAQAYRILVPERRGRRSNRSDHDDCSYLRPSVFGPPEVICCLSLTVWPESMPTRRC
jgi:hypothetical protein